MFCLIAKSWFTTGDNLNPPILEDVSQHNDLSTTSQRTCLWWFEYHGTPLLDIQSSDILLHVP